LTTLNRIDVSTFEALRRNLNYRLEIITMMHVTKIGESSSCQNRQNDKRHPKYNVAHFSLPFTASLPYPADKGKTHNAKASSADLKDGSFRLGDVR